MKGGLTRLAVLGWLLGSAAAVAAQEPREGPANLAAALSGIAGRVQQYYDRISTIICIETVTQQEIKSNLAPIGKPRVTVYELSVTSEPNNKGVSEFRVERKLQSVNGKPARKNQEPGCTDPKTGTPEPLEFLLPGNQKDFKFAFAKTAGGGPDTSVAVDFTQTSVGRVEVEWSGNCFNATGGGQEGRFWFDPSTFDVLQVDVRLAKPFLIAVPAVSVSNPPIRVDRSDVRMRFSRLKFENPDETVLLPVSTEVVTLFRGAPSLKTFQSLTNFRRFLSESTVRPAGR